MPMAEMIARFACSLDPKKSLADVDGEALAESWRQICFSMIDDSVQPIPGAIACVAGLVAEGMPVGILTNGWSPLQERKIARALGVFPGPIIVSAAVRAYKPSAKAFLALESALGCDAAESLVCRRQSDHRHQRRVAIRIARGVVQQRKRRVSRRPRATDPRDQRLSRIAGARPRAVTPNGEDDHSIEMGTVETHRWDASEPKRENTSRPRGPPHSRPRQRGVVLDPRRSDRRRQRARPLRRHRRTRIRKRSRAAPRTQRSWNSIARRPMRCAARRKTSASPIAPPCSR